MHPSQTHAYHLGSKLFNTVLGHQRGILQQRSIGLAQRLRIPLWILVEHFHGNCRAATSVAFEMPERQAFRPTDGDRGSARAGSAKGHFRSEERRLGEEW